MLYTGNQYQISLLPEIQLLYDQFEWYLVEFQTLNQPDQAELNLG